MLGARFRRIVVRRPNLRIPFPKHFAERLQGTTVRALTRRGKYLLAELSSGETLIIHLGMSGSFDVDVETAKRGAHRLAAAIKKVLTDAVERAMADSYRSSRFRVYDREGTRCPTRQCGGTIRRIVQAGRSTFYCPVCQR